MFKNGMRPVHPGEILLEDYIKPMGVSLRAVSLALHVPCSRLSEITKNDPARVRRACGMAGAPPMR